MLNSILIVGKKIAMWVVFLSKFQKRLSKKIMEKIIRNYFGKLFQSSICNFTINFSNSYSIILLPILHVIFSTEIYF